MCRVALRYHHCSVLCRALVHIFLVTQIRCILCDVACGHQISAQFPSYFTVPTYLPVWLCASLRVTWQHASDAQCAD
jgi:hypothetical protein